ncbi:MAG: hypothetical protein RMJ82_10200 [Gemmatales bacterium]|nr:hypothetical protein [Gemmatales bacterium]
MTANARLAEEIRKTVADDLYDALSGTKLQSLLDGAPADQETHTQALEAAVALGYCRLYDITLGEEDGVLPKAIAQVAAVALASQLDNLIQDAENLPQRWDETEEPSERDELCLSLLEERMNAQAAYIAIEEALLEAQSEGEISWAEYSMTLDSLIQRLEQIDQALRTPDRLHILSTVAHYPLLRNWRQMLGGDYRFAQFWWLSGQLERWAEALTQHAEAELPSASVWQQVRRVEYARYENALLLLRLFLLNKVFTKRIAAAGETLTVTLRWLSPDGQYEAVCSLSANEQFPELLRLHFLRATGEAAPELVGAPVSWAHVVTCITEDGVAAFPGADLEASLKAQQPPELVVGSNMQVWSLDPESVEVLQRLGDSSHGGEDSRVT